MGGYTGLLVLVCVTGLLSPGRGQDGCTVKDGRPGETGLSGLDGRQGAAGQKGEPGEVTVVCDASEMSHRFCVCFVASPDMRHEKDSSLLSRFDV